MAMLRLGFYSNNFNSKKREVVTYYLLLSTTLQFYLLLTAAPALLLLCFDMHTAAAFCYEYCDFLHSSLLRLH